MSTPNSFPASSESVTGSLATVVKAVHGARGYEKIHVAVGDATRLAYVEVLPDEQKGTMVGFLTRAMVWFSQQLRRVAQPLQWISARGWDTRGRGSHRWPERRSGA